MLKCKCIRNIKFDNGIIFEMGKRYFCETKNGYNITIYDSNLKNIKLYIDGTFQNHFQMISR
jgi:hypothetical protein